MFKFFAIVFAAIVALAAAAPKPGLIGSPLVASSPIAYNSYASPLVYSAGYSAPLTYNTYASPYAYSAGYPAAPLAYY